MAAQASGDRAGISVAVPTAAAPLSRVARRMLDRARSQLGAGDVGAAERSLAAAEALVPGNAEVIRLTGRVAQQRGDFAKLIACYQQVLDVWAELRGDAGFTCDLDDMADYCIDFLRLTGFWLERFPDRVLDLEYEALVAEPESTVRRLLAFCGLAFDPACLAFHRADRSVLSAPSAIQVRQPLRHDTARADRYGDKLDRLRARLQAADLPLRQPKEGASTRVSGSSPA